MRRYILLLSLILWASVVPAEKGGRIEVEWWHAMGGRHGNTVNEIAERFNESQSRYLVVPIYQGRYNSLSQKLIASLYAGRNPAISQMYPGWTTRFFRYGYLKPVQEFIDEDPDFGEDDLADFYPVMLEEGTMKDPRTGEQVLTTIPFNKSVYVLYVNQTRMNEVGWEDPPKTWDEFYELAREMTVMPEGAQRPTFYGFATRPYIEDFTVQAFSAGIPLYNEDTGEIQLDSERGRKALTFLKSLVSGDASNSVGYVETDYLSNAFGSEQIGMFISSTASFPYNDQAVGQKFIWMAYAVPSMDEETAGRALMQGTNLGIFGNVPEEVQQGAWEFLKFSSSPEMTAMWAKETGYLPVRRSARQVVFFAEHLERDIRYANAVDCLERATFEPRLMYWESVRSIISREVEGVLQNRKSVDEALEAARRAIEETRERAD